MGDIPIDVGEVGILFPESNRLEKQTDIVRASVPQWNRWSGWRTRPGLIIVVIVEGVQKFGEEISVDEN